MTNEQVRTDDRPDVEVIEATAIQSLAKAELDQQITTAKAYPRSLVAFQRDALSMATLNTEVADDCIYAVPREGKLIEGPSARFAEIIVAAWGNCRVASRILDEGATFVTAQGIFIDLQRNNARSVEVRRRITKRGGQRYSDDGVNNAANAAAVIASRNATFQGIPRALWWPIYQQVRKTAAGDEQTMAARRNAAIEYLVRTYKITPARIYAGLGVKGPEDIGLEQIAALKGIIAALRDGEARVDDAFPDPSKPKATEAAPQAKAAAGAEGLKAALAGSKDAPPPQEGPAQPAQEAKPEAPAPNPSGLNLEGSDGPLFGDEGHPDSPAHRQPEPAPQGRKGRK